MTDPLEAVPTSALRPVLEDIRELEGESVAANVLRDRIPGFRSQRGIYKPAGSKYALWVRETLGGPYADERPVILPDGSWTYRYAPEGRAGRPELSLATNRGLLRCMEDRVPIGVFRQEGSGGARGYSVLGLAFVVRYEDGLFLLRGEPIDESAPPISPEAIPEFRPFESEPLKLSPMLRVQRAARFRGLLRVVYHDQCSLCKLGYRFRGQPLALEAAHVIPVDRKGSLKDLRNGLLLCGNHHTLFDAYAWALDENYRVLVTHDSDFRGSAGQNHILQAEGQRLPNLPDLVANRPAPEAIAWRLAEFERHQP